jgi:two-component system sensor histidine kinase KdpD
MGPSRSRRETPGSPYVPSGTVDPAEATDPTRPGGLHVFLGTAVGVGKTYAMFNEGWRRAQAGEDVVIGYWEPHGRPETGAQLRGLEVVPPRVVTYRDTDFEDLDVDAVVRRAPDVALVDELAHTGVGDCRPRWQDVEDLRRAGIDVISTLNVANLDAAREYAAEVTGAGAVECVPDDVLRGARVDLVDLPPDALRQRVASGYVYSADRVGGALANYFRFENLSALSELGRAWMNGTLDQEGPTIVARYTEAPPRSVVLAGVSSREGGESVIQRAVELAASMDSDLVVVHLIDGRSARTTSAPKEYRQLAGSLGATYREALSEDPVDGLAMVAAEYHASVIVVGQHRSRWVELLRGSVARRLRRRLPDVTIETVEQG